MSIKPGNITTLGIDYSKHTAVSCSKEQSAVPFVTNKQNLITDDDYGTIVNQAIANDRSIGYN